MDYPKSVAGVGLVDGKFVDENATTGQVGSLIPSAWGNAVTDEILAVLAAAGIVPDEAKFNQLALAVQALIGAALVKSNAVVGSARNVKMTVAAASTTATLMADELVVSAALGGMAYRLGGFNKTINLATTGAGGMDTGAAPANGYVALYAIYNPTTGATALLGVNATSAAVPEVYGGANMPTGYADSALVSVWPTNAGGQFKIGSQRDRRVSFGDIIVLTSNVNAASPTSLSISAAAPQNAKSVSGSFGSSSTSAGVSVDIIVGADANLSGAYRNNNYAGTSGQSAIVPFGPLDLAAAQTIYYTATVGSGTPTHRVFINGYTF